MVTCSWGLHVFGKLMSSCLELFVMFRTLCSGLHVFGKPSHVWDSLKWLACFWNTLSCLGLFAVACMFLEHLVMFRTLCSGLQIMFRTLCRIWVCHICSEAWFLGMFMFRYDTMMVMFMSMLMSMFMSMSMS